MGQENGSERPVGEARAASETTSSAQLELSVVKEAPAALPVPGTSHLPEKLVKVPEIRKTRKWRVWILLGLLAIGGIGGGVYWWWYAHQFHLPPGFAYGNGRLEADPIDISTKFAGRIAEIMVDEGYPVTAGQVVARIDTRDLEATLKSYMAQKTQAEHSLDEARALVVQQKTQVVLAQQEIDRTQALVGRGFATVELLDQRRQVLEGANAGLRAAVERVNEAEHAVAVVSHNIELYRVNIADDTLVAPKDGRIEYRVSNVGEVLPAGGKVFTMLDLSYVYMDIYLSTADAGRAVIGSEARIVLDAFPNIALPAHVSYIATEAQFTPKAVETRSERDKLMFRVKARIDTALLENHAADVRTGLPGLAYVRLDPKADWPAELNKVPAR
jgi:HlyD family secretion protein